MTQLTITFLGTSGSWPTAKRNVTAIAIKRESEVILFDCGEGTQRQFQKSKLSYMQISKIFITHFHGDHFLGLPGLFQTMQLNDREKPLHIYGPKGLNTLIKQLLSLGHFNHSFKIISHEIENENNLDFEEYTIDYLKVDHGVPTLAYCLEEKLRPGRFNKSKALKLGIPEGPLFSKLQKGNKIILENGKEITPDMVLGTPRKGRKIVISGDTRPNKKIVDFSKDADVLIHEATFDSKMEKTANEYGHSTAKQAAEIAKMAGVEKLFLTHISPRYLKSDILEEEAREVFQKSYVSKDFQQVEVELKK